MIAVGARIAVGAGVEVPLGGGTRLAHAGLVDVDGVLALGQPGADTDFHLDDFDALLGGALGQSSAADRLLRVAALDDRRGCDILGFALLGRLDGLGAACLSGVDRKGQSACRKPVHAGGFTVVH